MADRDKILRYYKAGGDSELAVKLLDLAEAAVRSRKYKISEFLDPYGYTVAETIAAHHHSLTLCAEGGYVGAERVRIALIADDFFGKPDFEITALAAQWDARYHHLSHRDVLGALMGLGVKREVLGDIVMTDSGCQIITDSAISSFIAQQLTMVGSASIEARVIPVMDILPREEKIKEIRTTVASLRLDVIAAAGFGVSRSRMADDIAAAKLKVNWQDAKSSSQGVKVGDIISMRGRGRVEVCELFGQTKKGRTSILLKRFM